jgi:hypothetical protein
LRFVAAIVSFVIAFGLIGLGIAQRTVFAEPDRVTSQATAEQDAPITIIDGSALNARDGRQKLEIGSKIGGEVFAAYGRTSDLIAWAGDTSYNHVTYDNETGELTTELVKGTTDEAIAPAGSDLWIGEYSGDGVLGFTVNLPRDVSIIVLSDGVKPAPSSLSVTWAVDNRAPLSGTLLIGGVLFLLLGLGLYLWALAHLRKTRGPRRKPPKSPTQQKLPSKPRYNYRKATKAVRGVKPKPIENPRGRRSAGRMTAVLPVVLVSAVVLSGCSASELPDFITGRSAHNVPAPTASAASTDEIVQTPAVTVPQLETIVERVSKVAATADADRNPELAGTRFTGAALQLREANYAIRLVDNSIPALPAIPPGPVELTLPQQSDVWPRTVFTVIHEAAPPKSDPAPTGTDEPAEPPAEGTVEEPTVVPTALMLVQETPRDQYKVAYAVVLEANAQFNLAAASVGAVRQDPANRMLKLPPGELAAAYADVMMQGDQSEFYEKFDYKDDALIPAVGAEAKAARAAALSTTTLEYATAVGVGDPIAMASVDSGAIVAVSTAEVESAKPAEAGAILSPEAGTKALSGVEKTTKGVAATYAYQLLFYVPPAASNDKIVLLGFSEGLVAAKEL